jgi:hypothetical protein
LEAGLLKRISVVRDTALETDLLTAVKHRNRKRNCGAGEFFAVLQRPIEREREMLKMGAMEERR